MLASFLFVVGMPSSVISAITYDSAQQALEITYVSGLRYVYHGVPEKLAKEMKAATSKGRFLNYQIKGKYTFEKLV